MFSPPKCFPVNSVEAAGGKALPCVVDVRDETQISEAVENAVQKFGGETDGSRALTQEEKRGNDLFIKFVLSLP